MEAKKKAKIPIFLVILSHEDGAEASEEADVEKEFKSYNAIFVVRRLCCLFWLCPFFLSLSHITYRYIIFVRV